MIPEKDLPGREAAAGLMVLIKKNFNRLKGD
jgi:hypothetical protein